ncbi:MAG: glycosyltransferase [Candidatus Eisenbacteria bacterium]|nr:glycosyltransferase [Candidatus Eisenbacteria bacterium]
MNGPQHDPAAGRYGLSIVCVPSDYAGDLAQVHRDFRDVLARGSYTAEFLYVLDGPRPAAEKSLASLQESRFPVSVHRMAKGFGQSAALQYAFERAQGRFVLTIPDRQQVEPEAILQVIAELEKGEEAVVTRREPRKDPLLNRIQSKVFHSLVRRLSGQSFRDMTCGLRGFTREAAARLDLYGDLHRFIPVLVARRGYLVKEIPVRQREEDRQLRMFGPGVYARRLLDILHVFFLTRFTRKPLRFFGLVGFALSFVGLAIAGLLALLRIFGGTSLADRPLLVLAIVLIILGVQVISIGLIGEIVIFLSPKQEEPNVRELERETRAH